MSSLSDFNEFSCIGSMLNKKELSPYMIQKRKYLYLEGMVRFLELYGKNEIGEVEVDIEKISLWINSSHFENVDIYRITGINKVFEMLENDLMNNVPLFRFLKLSDYQRAIFEQDHHDRLKTIMSH